MMCEVLGFVGYNYLSIIYENESEMVLGFEVQGQQVYLHL